MPSLVRFGAAVALLVAATSCGGPTETASTDAASPEASSAPTASESPAVPKADFKSPMVAGKPATSLPAMARFIQPTNIDARNKQTQAEIQGQAKNNRRDPFAIPLQVRPEARLGDGSLLTPKKPASQQTPAERPIAIPRSFVSEPQSDSQGRAFRGYGPPALGDPPNPRPAQPATTARPQRPATVARPQRPATVARPQSPSVPVQPAAPAAPPAPSDALALKVTGVVQVGNEFKVIVQIPGENTERYVSVGDRIANGQVLVKRVELNKVLDPVVIFEQYGQEVAKNVGDTNPAIAMR